MRSSVRCRVALGVLVEHGEMVSAAASPRCNWSLTAVSRFRGANSSSMAMKKATTPPTVVVLLETCPAAIETMMASASAAMNWMRGS
jgi:hypothetical protein